MGDSGFTVPLHAADGQHVIEAVNLRTGRAFRAKEVILFESGGSFGTIAV